MVACGFPKRDVSGLIVPGEREIAATRHYHRRWASMPMDRPDRDRAAQCTKNEKRPLR